MDQLRLGLWMGQMEARVSRLEEDARHRLSKDSPRQSTLVALAPYVWGAAIIGLALAGKMTIPEAMRALGGP